MSYQLSTVYAGAVANSVTDVVVIGLVGRVVGPL